MLPHQKLELRILRFLRSSGELNWRATTLPELANHVGEDWNSLVAALDRLHQQGIVELQKWVDSVGFVPYEGLTTASEFFHRRDFQMRMTSVARPYLEALLRDEQLEEHSMTVTKGTNMDKCFVIMPIGKTEEERKKWREIFETIFKRSVESSGWGLKCERADDIHESGSIMRQVLLQLHSARLVLADLTTQNANVFYELGVRHAMGKRTILVGQSPQDSPFDTHQYRVLIYKYPLDSSDEFHANIRKFLEDAIRNPQKPDNPVADLLPALAEAPDQVAVQALILELEDNLKAANQFQVERSYVAPSNAEWLNRRALLNGLPDDLRTELTAVYDKVRQWKAIVDSGINALTGSMEIPKICQQLKSEVPPLIEKLKGLLEK